MNLDQVQRDEGAAWIAEGLKLSEIQARLASEFGLRLTYMEVRLLVDDLRLTPKDPIPSPPADFGSKSPAADKLEPASQTGKPTVSSGTPGAGSVSVTVDQLARPGTVVSGKVTFSDNQQAEWYLDQTGRLGLVPKQQGYKPAQVDVQQFQMALESELAKMGF